MTEFQLTALSLFISRIGSRAPTGHKFSVFRQQYPSFPQAEWKLWLDWSVEQLLYFFHFHSETCSRAFDSFDNPWSTQRVEESVSHWVPIVVVYCLVIWPLSPKLNKSLTIRMLAYMDNVRAFPILVGIFFNYLKDSCTRVSVIIRIRLVSRTVLELICLDQI